MALNKIRNPRKILFKEVKWSDLSYLTTLQRKETKMAIKKLRDWKICDEGVSN